MSNTRLAGAFTATGQSGTFVVSARNFLLKIGGTFTATVVLQIFNTQLNDWQDIQSYTAPVVRTTDAVARGQRFRLNCSAFTSGTVSYEFDAPND
jgi:hypothetical protein